MHTRMRYILSTKHCVVHSSISLAGVHSEVSTRCSEVESEWLESWNLFLVLRNKNLWSRNSVLRLGQTDKRKMRLVTSNTVVVWCVAVCVVSANPGKWKELTTTFAKSFKINKLYREKRLNVFRIRLSIIWECLHQKWLIAGLVCGCSDLLGPFQTSNFTCAELNSYFSRLK